MVHSRTWCKGTFECVCVWGGGGGEVGWTLCMCVGGGGGGGVSMQQCICTVSWKWEVYSMHLMSLLNCLHVTVILSQIPWCDCCLSANYVSAFVCACMHVNYSLMLHMYRKDKFPCLILAWIINNLIVKVQPAIKSITITCVNMW